MLALLRELALHSTSCASTLARTLQAGGTHAGLERVATRALSALTGTTAPARPDAAQADDTEAWTAAAVTLWGATAGVVAAAFQPGIAAPTCDLAPWYDVRAGARATPGRIRDQPAIQRVRCGNSGRAKGCSRRWCRRS